MFHVTQLTGFGSGGSIAGGVGSGPSVTYTHKATDTSNKTAYRYLNVPIGPAASNRYVVVFAGAGNQLPARAIDYITVNGQATIIAGDIYGVGTCCALAITSATVTSGTSATVIVKWSNPEDECTIIVWAVTGISSPTPVDVLTVASNDPTGIIDVSATGVLIAGAYSNTDGSAITWTGVIEDAESGGFGYSVGAGSTTVAAGEVGRTVKAAFTPSNDDIMVAASWV